MLKQIKKYLNNNLEESFEDYKAEIKESNTRSLMYLAYAILIFSFFSSIACLYFSLIKNSYLEFLILMVISFTYIVVIRRIKFLKHTLFNIYCYLALIALIFVINGTFLNKDGIGVFVCIFLIIVPIYLLDSSKRIIIFNMTISLVNLVLCYCLKENTIFIRDLLNNVGALIISVSITLYLINSKINDIRVRVQLKKDSQYDELTKVYNRTAIDSYIIRNLENSVNYYALILLDIDNFKNINDKYGHNTGDMVLKKIGSILQKTFRTDDIIVRLGGDEFIVFLKNLSNSKIVEKKAEDLIRNINTNIELEDNNYVTCSAGIVYSNKKTTFKKLYNKADKTMYEAKENGKNNYKINYE